MHALWKRTLLALQLWTGFTVGGAPYVHYLHAMSTIFISCPLSPSSVHKGGPAQPLLRLVSWSRVMCMG